MKENEELIVRKVEDTSISEGKTLTELEEELTELKGEVSNARGTVLLTSFITGFATLGALAGAIISGQDSLFLAVILGPMLGMGLAAGFPGSPSYFSLKSKYKNLKEYYESVKIEAINTLEQQNTSQDEMGGKTR